MPINHSQKEAVSTLGTSQSPASWTPAKCVFQDNNLIAKFLSPKKILPGMKKINDTTLHYFFYLFSGRSSTCLNLKANITIKIWFYKSHPWFLLIIAELTFPYPPEVSGGANWRASTVGSRIDFVSCYDKGGSSYEGQQSRSCVVACWLWSTSTPKLYSTGTAILKKWG